MTITYSQMHLRDKYSQHSSIIWSSSKEFLHIQANIECSFTLKCVRDMTRIASQMQRTDKYSQHNTLIIWSVWPNGLGFVYELSGCEFECSCSHLNFRHDMRRTYSEMHHRDKDLQHSSNIWSVWPNG